MANIIIVIACFLLIHVFFCLFTKLLWPGNSKGIFCSSSQIATCLSHGKGIPLSFFVAERRAGKLRIPVFMSFDLTDRDRE